MTSVMNIKIPELDILDGGYNPQGVVDLEAEQKAIRVLLTEIAKGNRAFPVEIQNNQPVN
jgi:hypothetical protein